MKINFQKYHGAGNDFIILNASYLKHLNTKTIRALCDRKTSIGADGLIALTNPQKNSSASFIYFNSDGREADFCGNGLRCAAMFCYLNFNCSHISFKTKAGLLRTQIINDKKVSVQIPIKSYPKKIRFGKEILFFCNTGVPHSVQIVANIQDLNVLEKGEKIRFHPFFSPQGTNANFAKILSRNKILIRTYERGVEDETEACGSGAAASALSLATFANLKFPIKVLTKSKYILKISKPKELINKLILEGPAELSFSGQITI